MTPCSNFTRSTRAAFVVLGGLTILSASGLAAAMQADGINALKTVSHQQAEDADKKPPPPPPPPKTSDAPAAASAVSATDLSTAPAEQRILRPMTLARPALLSRKDQKLAEGRALVAEAEQFNAGYAPGAEGPTKAELEASIADLKSDLDSMSEMGEMESMRLQMAMDRLSKMMSTLSNLLKKASETQNSIVQNIK